MRLLYTILILVFLVPFASASANVVGLASNSYNLGDSIELAGSVSYSSGFNGYMNLIADCSNPVTLDTALLNLKANEEYRFSKTYTLTDSFEGTCKLILKTTDLDGRKIEEASYGSVTVSKDLKVNIDSRVTRFQLGDTLSITGLVEKQRGLVTTGIATLSFKEKDVTRFTESVKIQDGKFNFTRALTLIPAGEYSIDVKAQDEFGNEKTVTNVFSFSVNNQIAINYVLSRLEYLPGENMGVKGNVRGEISDSLANVELTFNVDNTQVSNAMLETSKEAFSFEYGLANNVKSGLHNFTIFAKDTNGNSKSLTGTFYVKAVPTTFTAGLVKQTDFVPEDTVKLTINLLDQANDKMPGIGTATLYDSEETEIDSKSVALGTEGFFILPQFAKAGVWSIIADAEEMSETLTFTVLEQVRIDTWVEGQTLHVRNLGNVPYNGELKVYAENNKTLDGSKKLELGINEATSYDLASMFPSGTYKIKTPLSNESFDNVRVVRDETFFEKVGKTVSGITGGAVYGVKTAATSTIGMILILLIVIVLVGFIARGAVIKSRNKKVWERESQFAAKRKTEIMREKGYVPSVNKKKTSEDPEMKSFVQTLAKRAAEEPKPFTPIPKGEGTYINMPNDEPKNKGGSAFGSMFDF